MSASLQQAICTCADMKAKPKSILILRFYHPFFDTPLGLGRLEKERGERLEKRMNRKILHRVGFAAIVIPSVAFALPALAYSGQKYRSEAKIGMSEARTIALKAYPGKITDEELEHEGGGSGLRYSFDIKRGGHTQEVGVDAKSGRVLENDAEGANPD
jgi:uncharacterized membrane protein YkoI